MSRRVGLRFGGRARLCLALAATGILMLGQPFGGTAHLAAQGAMALPGKFEVSPTGGASYTIAIAVPPGSGGMVPSVALSYNSQGRNGLVGMGWHIEGLPSIDRCARTVAQDGVRGSVNYDADDRFCLDGQRLVAISGTYGADGTEYRTEIESFAKIVSRGTAGTGPAWFEVWTKSGQRMEFGNSTDSRVLAQGKPTARDWVVNKVSDTKGNYFTVTFVNDTANGQVYPDRIDYTGNGGAGLVPYNSVRFVYDTARPDVVPAYHAGSLQKTTVRLSKVQTFAGSTMVADYRLAYEQGPTTGRSRLTSVTLCDGAGVCLPASTFGWQSGSTTPTVITNAGGQDGTLSTYRPYLADFNGDGFPDIMWDKGNHTTSPRSTGARVLWTSTGGGNFTVTSNFAGQDGTLSNYTPVIADFDRDGRPDILWYSINSSGVATGAWTKWLNGGGGTFTVGGLEGAAPTNTRAGIADLDGDGRSDIIWFKNNTLTVWITKTDGTVSAKTLGGSVSAGDLDYNGDGLADIFWLGNDSAEGRSWALLRGQGDGTFTQVNSGMQISLNGSVPYFIDINGDGKTDIVWNKIDSKGLSTGQRILWLGKGDGTYTEQTNVAGQDGQLSGYRAYIADFNGDGLPDILWVQDTGGTPQEERTGGSGTPGPSGPLRVLWLGKGDGTFTVITNYAGQDGTLTGYAPVIADFNGDGKADILWDSRTGTDTRSTGTRVLWLSDGVAPDLMTSVTTGLGAKVTVTYKSMTDGSVYTKDSTTPGGLVDVIDLQGPMALVSKVDASNALGGVVSTGYAYAGAKSDLNGRGFLGFRQMTVKDLQTNLVQTTDYRQDFPYIALVAGETKKLGAVTLSATVHAYGATPLGGTRVQAFLVQSQAQSADLNGAVLPTVTSAYKYDIHGNATEIVVSATDGFSKTTTNIYANDTAKWLLGRLTRATVASSITTPGSPPAQPPTTVEVVLPYSANNINLWNYLLANGLAKAGTPGTWTITIPSNVVIGSASTSLPALDTGSFPAGSTLKIVNNGTIVGIGGKGGDGGWFDGNCSGQSPAPGGPGGAALRVLVPVTVVNNGKIWGGGGGGGGGASIAWSPGGGGGGGAGTAPGAGGWGLSCYADESGLQCSNFPNYNGKQGTLTLGGGAVGGGAGAGGNPGLAGASGVTVCGPPSAGGAAGPAVIGNSFVTWEAVGDRQGPLN